ncbi:MAG TPA: type II toxin-antitoxin system RelE/ParE family toxin [Chthoniobacterales bacterium]|nr:type II toxin-antitoxin system RelE/ParE family toxin [Chthoniobacterales bacterium]
MTGVPNMIQVMVPEPLRLLSFYRTENGRALVQEWLRSLTNEEKKRIGKELAKLQFYDHWPAGLVKCLRDGLRELRVSLKKGEARVLFFEQQNELVLVHAFWKKTQTTPKDILNEALKRKRNFEQG